MESSGKAQALHFIGAISPFEIDMPLVLDFEIAAGSSQDKEKIVGEVSAFLQEIAEYTGIEPIITEDAYMELIKLKNTLT